MGVARPLVTSVAVCALYACANAKGSTVQAPVDLTIAPIGSAAATRVTSGKERATDVCSLRLFAERIEKSAASCSLDEHLSEGPGVLRYPCSSDGVAEADFGQDHYTGRIDHGEVELELRSELDWEDGCRWGTQATITGTLVSGERPALRKLTWQYLDHVVSGSGCSGVCSAKASIAVKPSGGPAGPKRGPEENDDPGAD